LFLLCSVLQEMKLGSLLYLFSWNGFALAKEGFCKKWN